jgi:hypothetical protein
VVLDEPVPAVGSTGEQAVAAVRRRLLAAGSSRTIWWTRWWLSPSAVAISRRDMPAAASSWRAVVVAVEITQPAA